MFYTDVLLNHVIDFLLQVPKIAILCGGGGFRAMVYQSGVFCALKDMGVLDCTMYATGLSGGNWYVVGKPPSTRFVRHLII